jgi:hypothetical protein
MAGRRAGTSPAGGKADDKPQVRTITLNPETLYFSDDKPPKPITARLDY